MKLIDLTGGRFGRLVVLGRDKTSGGREPRWLCRCDCGVERSVIGSSLRGGETSSCGCLRNDRVRKAVEIEMAGVRYGHLVGTYKIQGSRFSDRHWMFSCDCGGTICASGYRVRSGAVTDCGCSAKLKSASALLGPAAVDLSGKSFGVWTVIEPTMDRSDNRVVWRCRCSCGAIELRDSSSVQSTRSARCRHRRSSPEAMAVNKSYDAYRQGARSRDFPFDLSVADFEEMFFRECHYCGRTGVNFSTVDVGTGPTEVRHNGVDRVDSSRGYSVDNCVSCCKNCNRAKSNLGYEEFIDLCAMIVKNRRNDEP